MPTRRKSHTKSRRTKKQKRDAFYSCYPSNIKKIKKAIVAFSGKHQINKAIAEQFIHNQLSEVRKQAARDLVENTVYITLAEVSEIIEQLIIQIYDEHNLNAKEHIYMYCSKPSKSFYFISVLALYHIRKNGYKEPTQFVSDLNNDMLDKIGEHPLLILDDVSYSGSQLSNMLSNIYYSRVVKSKKSVPTIHVGLIGLTTFSKKNLEMVPTKKTKSGIVLEKTRSPFQLYYIKERLYTPLIVKLGIQRYFNMNTFFSPYTQGNPHVSIYLDHKMADDVSTYKLALSYGPIVPANYNYGRYIKDTQGFMNAVFPNKNLFEPGVEDQLVDEYNKVNNTKFTELDDYHLTEHLYNALVSEDVIEEENKINKIQFYPFIETCNTSPPFVQVIENKDIAELNYSVFIAPRECVADDNLECDDLLGIENVQEFIMEECETIGMDVAIEMSHHIHDAICSNTWYKKGIFRMSCISSINKSR